MRCWRGRRGEQLRRLVDARFARRRTLVGHPPLDGGLAPQAAVLVVQPVDRHPPDPADRILVAVDAPPVQVGLDERLLHRVGRRLAAAAGDGERPDQPPVVGAEQRFEVVDELDLADVGHGGRSRTSAIGATHGGQCPRDARRGQPVPPRGHAVPGAQVWSRATVAAMHERGDGDHGVDEILDVDLLAFEQHTRRARGAPSSTESAAAWPRGSCIPATISREDLLDSAYGMLREFFAPAAGGQAAVRRARSRTARPGTPGCSWRPLRRATCRTGRRCSTGVAACRSAIRCAPATRTATGRRCCPEEAVPGIDRGADARSTRRSRTCSGASCGSSPRRSAATPTSSTR